MIKSAKKRISSFFFSYFAYIGVFSPYLSLWLNFRGFGPSEIGILLSPMQWARIIGPPFWGTIADNGKNEKFIPKVLTISAILAFFSAFLLLLNWTFIPMFLILCCLSFFLSGLIPIVETLALKNSKNDLGVYGRIRVWGSIGFILSVIVAGGLLDTLGIKYLPFFLISILFFMVFSTIFLFGISNKKTIEQKRTRIFFNKKNYKFFLASFFMLIAHSPLYVLFSLWLESFGFDKLEIGLIWALGVFSEIFFFLIQKRVFIFFGSIVQAWTFSFFIAAIRFLMIVLSNGNFFVIVLSQLLHSITFGLHHSASIALIDKLFPKGAKARGQSFYTMASYGLGGSIGGILSGFLWDFVFPEAGFIMAIIAALIGGVIAATMKFDYLQESKN